MAILRSADQSACLYSYTGICLRKAPLQEYHDESMVSTVTSHFLCVVNSYKGGLTMLLLNSLMFMIGACCGSFITCMAERLSDMQSLYTKQRSVCPQCQHQLRFWQLIPLLGVLLQRGKCFDCQKAINLRSTWIELICGGLVLLNWQMPLPLSVPLLLGYAVLIFNSLTDRLSFSVFPITLILPGVIGLWFQPPTLSIPLAIVAALLLGLYGLAWKTKKFGLGDVDILVLLSCLAKPDLVLTSLTLASFAALLVFTLTRQRAQLPFVPFLTWAFIMTTQLA